MLKLNPALPSCASLITLFVVVVVSSNNEPELCQLTVVFRHGDRTPETFPKRFPNDPHMRESFYPMGPGGLTNVGKRRIYHLGELLRNRYDELLGTDVDERRIYALSSNLSRTKTSLLLVLAALYPPSLSNVSRWHQSLDWQPIPTYYNEFKNSKIFNSDKCERFVNEYARVYNSSEIQSKLGEFKPYLEYLRVTVGKKSPLTLNDILLLHNNLDIEKRMGLKMETWMEEALADNRLKQLRKLYYEINTYNEFLTRFQAGFIFRGIVEDMFKARNKTSGYVQKISLYSGHDKNIIYLLRALNIYDWHFSEFASALIFELWSQKENYYVKILHYLGIPEEFKNVTIPGCETLCPLDQFIRLTKNVQILDEEMDCEIKSVTYFEDED